MIYSELLSMIGNQWLSRDIQDLLESLPHLWSVVIQSFGYTTKY